MFRPATPPLPNFLSDEGRANDLVRSASDQGPANVSAELGSRGTAPRGRCPDRIRIGRSLVRR